MGKFRVAAAVTLVTGILIIAACSATPEKTVTEEDYFAVAVDIAVTHFEVRHGTSPTTSERAGLEAQMEDARAETIAATKTAADPTCQMLRDGAVTDAVRAVQVTIGMRQASGNTSKEATALAVRMVESFAENICPDAADTARQVGIMLTTVQ